MKGFLEILWLGIAIGPIIGISIDKQIDNNTFMIFQSISFVLLYWYRK